MLQEIRRERTLEFVGEHFRKYDLCRWGIAEAELTRPNCTYYVSYGGVGTELSSTKTLAGTSVYNASAWTGKITTEEQAQSTYTAGMPTLKAGALITETANNRKFSRENYLLAIPTSDIALNPNLKQNPSW